MCCRRQDAPWHCAGPAVSISSSQQSPRTDVGPFLTPLGHLRSSRYRISNLLRVTQPTIVSHLAHPGSLALLSVHLWGFLIENVMEPYICVQLCSSNREPWCALPVPPKVTLFRPGIVTTPSCSAPRLTCTCLLACLVAQSYHTCRSLCLPAQSWSWTASASQDHLPCSQAPRHHSSAPHL